MPKKFYTARYDRVFKSILCNENDLRILKKVLSVAIDTDIRDIIIKKCELSVSHVSERVKIVDLVVELNNKDIAHVELNLQMDSYVKFRNYVFFSKVISTNGRRGEKYRTNINYIHIDFTYGMNLGKIREEYYVQTLEGKKYIQNVKILEYDMDYIKKNCYNDVNYKYLAMLDMELGELRDIAKGDDVVMDYMEKLKKINDDSDFQSLMSQEEAAEMLVNNYVDEAVLETKASLIKSMANNNITIDEIAKIVQMSKKEVEEILKGLVN